MLPPTLCHLNDSLAKLEAYFGQCARMRDSISAAATTCRFIDKFCSNRNHTLPHLTSSDYLNLEEGRAALRQVRLELGL